MVPNQWPLPINQKTRHFSNYECLNANKPYQYNKYHFTTFKAILDNHETGHSTIIEIFDPKGVFKNALKDQHLYQDYPLLRRNKDGETLLKTFYKLEDHQMIGTLAPILLQSESSWAARDIIISDIFEIIKSDDMLPCFQTFFEDDDDDHQEGKPIDSEARFQMCEPRCEFLTTASDEQLYEARDT